MPIEDVHGVGQGRLQVFEGGDRSDCIGEDQKSQGTRRYGGGFRLEVL